MSDTDISLYSTIAVIVVLAVFLLVMSRRSGGGPISPMVGIAIGFFLGGLLYRDTRFVGGGLLTAAVLLAIVDQFFRLKKKAAAPDVKSGRGRQGRKVGKK
jgi:hypothetical protein